MTKQPGFSRTDVDIIERESPYQGFFRLDRLRLRHRLFNGGWSRELTRELFVRTEAVAVLPWDPVRDEILLVEQFRVGALDFRPSPWCLELIAGIRDVAGESLEQLVRREAQEEAGIALGELVPLPSYMASPGGSNERLHLFFAEADLSNAGGVHGHPEEGEDIRVQTVPVAQVPELIESGQLDNAPCLIALHWLMHHHQRLRQRHERQIEHGG